jgi:hypothetical protein
MYGGCRGCSANIGGGRRSGAPSERGNPGNPRLTSKIAKTIYYSAAYASFQSLLMRNFFRLRALHQKPAIRVIFNTLA